MWKLNGDDIKAMLLASAMVVVVMEMLVYAITGTGILAK